MASVTTAERGEFVFTRRMIHDLGPYHPTRAAVHMLIEAGCPLTTTEVGRFQIGDLDMADVRVTRGTVTTYQTVDGHIVYKWEIPANG